jgi:hypothetical protein
MTWSSPSIFACLVLASACASPLPPVGEPSSTTSDTTTSTGPGPGTTPRPTTGEAESTDSPATTMPMTEESTGNADSSGGPATCDPPCEAGEECIGGTCFDMGDSGSTGEPPPTSSDYGSCDMCAAGEMPVAIMGLDGFCFCSPVCDGMSCPAANEGTAMPICALGFEMGGPLTQCALLCEATEDCPMGATCENLGMASLCTFPVPA